MQRVDVDARGGMVTLEVEVGDRKVVALLTLEEAHRFAWALRWACTLALKHRVKRRLRLRNGGEP
jgi:hypothetical protein